MLTGMNTKVGSIAALLSSAEEDESNHKHAELAAKSDSKLIRQMTFGEELEVEESDDGASSIGDEDDLLVEDIEINSKKTGITGVYSRVSKFIESYQPKKTPLQEGLHRLGMTMTVFALTGLMKSNIKEFLV